MCSIWTERKGRPQMGTARHGNGHVSICVGLYDGNEIFKVAEVRCMTKEHPWMK